MNATRTIVSILAVVALSAIGAGCTQHMPQPPASPLLPNPPPDVPTPPSSNPTPPNSPNTNPSVSPESSAQPNPGPDPARQ
jgi:hypothetical protein